MAVSKQQARKVRQPVLTGDLFLTGTLDGTTLTEIVLLSSVAEKISVQSDGSLAGTVEFSINGTDFFGSAAFVATVPISYNTHLVRAVRVTQTGGTGKLHLLAI